MKYKLGALFGAVLLAGCGNDATTQTGAKTQGGAVNLVYCSEGSPSGFDAPQYSDGTTFDASAHPLYNRLIEFKDGSTEIRPALAERWEVSDDGKTYTLYLRHGVKFHTTADFTPTRDFNADDVVFSFNRMLDKNAPFNKAYPAEFPYIIDMELDKTIKAVERVDDYTVRFVLNEVNAPFLQNIAMPFASILSKEYADKLLAENRAADINTKPVGTGPFVLKSYQKDQQIRYIKHPDYWNKDHVFIDNLIFSITKDSGTRAQKVAAGECQVSRYPTMSEVESAKKAGNINVVSSNGYNTGYLSFNFKKGKLGDVRVREALDLAINKDAILSAVYQGAGTRAGSLMPPNQWGVLESAPSAYDEARARALLTEAGFNQEIALWYMPVQRPYNPNAKLMAEMIQADWAKVGVKAKLVTYEWGEYLKRAKDGEGDAVLVGWTGDNGDPDNWLATLFSCKSQNYSRYCSKAFDELVLKARATTDQNARASLYQDAQKILNNDRPAVYLAHSVVNVLTAPSVKNFKVDALGATIFEGVSLENP